MFIPVRIVLFASLVAALASAALSPSQAAKITQRPFLDSNDPRALDFEPRCNLQLTGEIVGPDPSVGQIGDHERMKEALDRFRLDPRRPVAADDNRTRIRAEGNFGFNFYAICLSSEGGDLREALRIAELLKYPWMTVIEEGHACLSACAVLFMQAKRRDGVFDSLLSSLSPGRYMHYDAELGFHAPALIYPAGASPMVAKEEAESAYKEAITSLEALLPGETRSRDYRSVEEFPSKLLNRMVTTPNSSMFKISTLGEAQEYGIGVFGLPVPKRLTDRMILSACISVVHARCSNEATRNQCEYKFANESYRILDPRSVQSDPKQGSFDAALISHFTGLDQDLVRRQRRVIDEMLTEWAVERADVWPAATKAAGLRVEAATLRRRLNPLWALPCAVVSHWDGDALVDIQLQTRNGDDRQWLDPKPDAAISERLAANLQRSMLVRATGRTPTAELDDERPRLHLADLGNFAPNEARQRIDSIRAGPETASRLRWYKIFPPTMPLAALGQDSWSWYEDAISPGPTIGGVATRLPQRGGDMGGRFERAIQSLGRDWDFAASEKLAPATAQERAAADGFSIKGWLRQVEKGGLMLTSPSRGGKEGIALYFPTRQILPADSVDAWFDDRVDRWLAGTALYKRNGLMRIGPLWIDAASVPGAQSRGGAILFFKAWKTPHGAQFVVQTNSEEVKHDDSYAIESDALIARLAITGGELSQNALRALHVGR